MADERTEKQKVKEITDKLEEGLKELFESEKYKSYLSTMSKFHNYSFNNIQLIAMQKPDATLVAGYRAWQKNFERHVNKGEKAIRILAPAPYKIKEEQDKLDPVTGEMMFDENGMPQKEEVEVTIPAFRVVSVFDVSQTDGKPIPELDTQELLSTVEGYEDFVQAVMNVAPVPIGFEDIPGDSRGYFSIEEKRIAVQENMSESQTLKTMVHEVAHSMLHDREVNRDSMLAEPAKDRNTKEVESESIAYTVLQHFGIDTSDYSFGYIAGWSSGKDMKELKSSLDTIRKTASELIKGIEGQLQELQHNREVEQGQDITLLVRNTDLSEYDLLNVRGMDTEMLLNSLLAMKGDDRQNVAAYLEGKGAWVTLLADEQTEEVREYHLDYSYNTDTHEITDIQYAMKMGKEEKEPIEAQLLYSSSDKYGIYQLKHDPELDQFRFEGTASLMRRGITKDNFDAIRPENYELVYVGELSDLRAQTQGQTLEAIFMKFNIDHPEDFKGHSLSVSDIVVLHENGENSAHFVDSFGFTRLPDFMRELEGVKEQEQELDTSGHDVNHLAEQNDLKSEPGKQKAQEKENTPEYIYKVEVNPRSDSIENRYFLQAYEVEERGKAIPRDVLYVGTLGKCRELMGQLVSGEMTQSDVKELSAKAQEALQEPEQAGAEKYPAVYRESLNYAMNHGEADKYLESRKLDRECKEAIEETIRQNFDGMHLKHDIVKPLAEQYGSERIAFVLANTLQQESWDGRFSRDNKAWASEFSIPENIVRGMDRNLELIVSSHPAVLDGFIGMFRSEVLEQEKELSVRQEKVTSGHDVQKLEAEQTAMGQPEPEQTQAEQPESQTEQSGLEKAAGKPEITDMDDGDEIIDLGDEREQILAEMKKSLEGEQEISEQELAFSIADRYISIQEVDGGYDYSIMGADYKEIDGGVYDNPDVTIREALSDIVDDLKSASDHNGAKGNIRMDDELIPIDYDGLMEKVEEANRIVPENTQSSVVADFRAKTDELFRDISEMNPAEIEETIKTHVQAKIDEYGMDAAIIDAVVVGSRCRGLEREGSDLDVVVELSANEREDDLFHAFNEDGLYIGGIKVDINPITSQRTGSLESYLPQVEEYLEGVRKAREQEQTRQVHEEVEKKEVEVTLTVAECGEFHNYGEFYENIPTVEEAVAIWKRIPPERLHGIPSIGINVHRPGEESYMDDEIDLLSGNRIDLEMLKHVPGITSEPKAMEMIAELVAKLPEMEIDGVMSEEMEALVWEKRIPDLEPAEQLAVEFDRFYFDYDAVLYHDSIRSMTENVSELHELIKQGDTGHLSAWLNEVIAEGAVPEETDRAKELLEKLAEYKPLAKIEEIEEQNYNMIDNVFNNGAEKSQRESVKKEQARPAARTSLKARLAEKKAQVAGHGQGQELQENEKKNQREM